MPTADPTASEIQSLRLHDRPTIGCVVSSIAPNAIMAAQTGKPQRRRLAGNRADT